MKTVIAKALFNSHSYLEYRKLVSDLLIENKSTAQEQTEDLTNYSHLNDTRMNRLDKTVRLNHESNNKMKSLQKEYIWLVITEGWCGDAAQILPVIDKLATASEGKIDLKIVLRDENEELMKLFLTKGTKAIPKLIIIDQETTEVLVHWGPRPEGATKLIQEYKKTHGVLDETAKTNLQLWYLHDKGQSIQNEIATTMMEFELS
ncbi:thioredoxin family protein [Flavobacterium algicola]|uniref:thioredoxin family protein n=1 Tax=Flavobacterium algicola TaxID=556529 RepID=UPI001EFCE0B5|nr:thioredoxin family protein [Flavobacterium algicola]MCG9792177.1 thioredoxin family protein [Flavobacterium algicola]